MEDTNIAQLIDHDRWLMSNGLIPESAKNQLFMYGSIVHKEVLAVDLAVDVGKYFITYKIYIDKSLLKKIEKFKNLQKSKSVIDLWRFKRLLKKEGNLNFDTVINNFIKDYCGNKWNSSVEVIDYRDYVPDGERHGEVEDS